MSAVGDVQGVESSARPRPPTTTQQRPQPPPQPPQPPQSEPETALAAAAAGAEPGTTVARLLVATEGRTVQEIPLRIGRVIIGRTPDNDVQIDSRFISRHHCQVITTAHSCHIEDLNSTNGIYVKATRVRRHHLNDGDVVLIGKHELIYVDERAARGRGGISEAVPRLDAEGE